MLKLTTAVVSVLAVVLLAGATAWALSIPSNKTDLAQVTVTGTPGYRSCGAGLVNATTSSLSVSYSAGPKPGVICLDAIVVNTGTEPMTPGTENLTVYDSSGRITFTELFAFVGDNTTELLPGQTWESTVYWNAGATAAARIYNITVVLPYYIGTSALTESASEALRINATS